MRAGARPPSATAWMGANFDTAAACERRRRSHDLSACDKVTVAPLRDRIAAAVGPDGARSTNDDFRKLLTAASELHKLDCRRQVSALWRCDAMQRNAIQCILCGYVMSAPAVEWRTARTAVVRRRALRLPVAPRGAVLAYRR